MALLFFLEWIGSFATGIISSLGYAGIVFLMALESTALPVPSELVMPFAGFLASQAKFDFLLLAVFSTIGSIIGSLFSYWLGLRIGKPFLERYGKYFLVSKGHIDYTENFFERHGDKTILFCRFVPAVRHLISIPAGIARMNLAKFIAYTAIGAFLWNVFLLWLGAELGQNWGTISSAFEKVDLAIAVLIILAIAFFVWSGLRKRKPPEKRKR